jgi:hypothetical protein
MKQQKMNISDVSQEKITKAKPVKHLSEIVNQDKKKNSKKFKITPKQRNIFVGIVSLLIVLAFPTYLVISSFTGEPTPPSQILTINKNYFEASPRRNDLQSSSIFTPSLPNPSEPKTKESPINGILLTDTKYTELMARLPVAAMVNNHALARPQSNISKADVVFETIAESGITRYMPIWWSENVNKVGPIRSARQYYVEWLSPYDALYIHDGYAMSDDPRVAAGANIVAYGIKDISTHGAWREYDGVRVAPHNEYSSPMTSWVRAETLGWGGFPENFTSWTFKPDAVPSERGTYTQGEIVFHKNIRNVGLYDVIWDYDETLNAYLRSVGGKADFDQENDQRITAKVVIVQFVKMINTGDDKGHIIIDTIGEGDAVIMQDGKKIEATWKKNSRTARTTYADLDGNIIEFNRGQIWVEGVPINVGTFDIIEK